MHNLAVIGNLVKHSLSPQVFGLFANQCGVKLNYNKLTAATTCEFNQQVQQFFASGGTALNVTSPFKHDAYLLATQSTPRAKLCKTSNFLFMNNKQMTADTTDGIGLVTDIEVNNKYSLGNKNILIIGSGFVVDSILPDIIVKNPATIKILARNNDKIVQLSSKFGVTEYQTGSCYDVIINTIPSNLENNLFAQITQIANNALCYDLGYLEHNTYFHQCMLKVNSQITCQNGLGMLVEQAAIAFSKLFNSAVNTQVVIDFICQNGYYHD
jgi:shikimate dehydrogenase